MLCLCGVALTPAVGEQALMACQPFCVFLKHLQAIQPALLSQKEPGLYCLAALAGEFEVNDEPTPETEGKTFEVRSLYSDSGSPIHLHGHFTVLAFHQSLYSSGEPCARVHLSKPFKNPPASGV